MEGDVDIDTNNGELPRLNFYKLRSQFKLNNSHFLNACTFNCSRVVRSTSFNNMFYYNTVMKQNVSIDNQDKSILLPIIVSNIFNTTSSNFATTLTSPSSNYRPHHPASYP